MDNPAQIVSQLPTVHAVQGQRITALEARIRELEAMLTEQHRISNTLRESLEELGMVEAELGQELAERDAAQQAVEAERQQYHTLFALAPDGYIVTDMVGVIHDANPAAARLLGRPQAYLLGKPLLGFVAREEVQRFHTLLHTLHQEPPTGSPWAGRFHPPRRPPFVGELTVTIRQERRSTRRWCHWLLRDITARVDAEAAVRHALIERQRLEREAQRAAHFALLGRLAAGVSHELRNPLAAIFLHVDLLGEELHYPSTDSPDLLTESLTEIRTNLVRVDDLMQDYLSLVRVAALERIPDDLGAALQAWAAEWQPLAAACGVTLRLEGVERAGVVAFHASTLRRALLNLVQNALDAMPHGGSLTLLGEATATAVQLHLQDTGHGIPPDRLPQIFEPLYTTKPGGTGLGLHIVREIVLAHGGDVTVESVEGQGTTFTLSLPVATDGSRKAEPETC